MKAFQFFPLVFLLLGLFSCQEDELPRAPLLGTWENRIFDETQELWFVESLTFKNDSVMGVEHTVRETETGPTLGYRIISEGWYKLEGTTLQYYYADALIYFGGGSDSDALPYGSKEELSAGIIDFFRIPEGDLTFSQDNNKFEFQEDCWQVNPDRECVEFPLKEYIRVN
ncbi:hypothetical protein [Algoriphagus hitonicola]|uniref:Uncharacterized protein n=1 Tax=Algoriphagus hitonicola TaxID=435880 RepID=A0A1I2UQW0_9BACT|nr:hypothetical protein [Algoriphagus hitonicola]SFG79492.1 hypothetical protein SAMN04487988_10882 [Algoriphagus hitonicola]